MRIHGEVNRHRRRLSSFTRREPIGAVGVILPWKRRSIMLRAPNAPPLAAGKRSMAKPS